ncbi:hypothetical protein ACTZQ7_26990, partial [Klebsiella pneumoniae]
YEMMVVILTPVDGIIRWLPRGFSCSPILGVWGAMEPKTNVRVYHRRSVPSSHAFASTLQLHKSASRFISDRS